MTSATSPRAVFQSLPEETRRAILAGGAIRAFAARAVVARCNNGRYAWAIDTLPLDGRSDEWEQVTQKILRIVKREVKRIDAPTGQVLQVIAAVTGEDLVVFRVDAWLSMGDDGGSLWTVTVSGHLAATALPAVVKASERVQRRVMKLVCSL